MAERGVEVDHSTINRSRAEVRPRTRQTNSAPSESHERLLAGGRNVHPDQRRVEVFVSSGGFSGQYALLPIECEARWQGSGALFPQSAQGDSHASSTGDYSGQECCLLGGNGDAQSGGSDSSTDRITELAST